MGALGEILGWEAVCWLGSAEPGCRLGGAPEEGCKGKVASAATTTLADAAEPGLWGSCDWKPELLLVSQPSPKGRRERGRNELTLPLPGQFGSVLCPLSPPCHPDPRRAGAVGVEGCCGHKPASQTPLDAFAECIIRALKVTTQTERTKKSPEIWARFLGIEKSLLTWKCL